MVKDRGVWQVKGARRGGGVIEMEVNVRGVHVGVLRQMSILMGGPGG